MVSINFLKNKKAVSPIIATLMIVLLTIVIFAIIAVVVRNTTKSGSENIALSNKCLEVDMQITKVSQNSLNNSQYEVILSRESGGDFDVDNVVLVFESVNNELRLSKNLD